MSELEADRLRIAEVLGMFHAHDPGLCIDFQVGHESARTLRSDCKVLNTVFAIIQSGETADEWWSKNFPRNNFPAWEEWLRQHGIGEGRVG